MPDKIRSFIKKNLIVYDDDVVFSDDDNIFALGFVNSLFATKLLTFIEREYGISVDNDDLDISNFSSVNNIVTFISSKSA